MPEDRYAYFQRKENEQVQKAQTAAPTPPAVINVGFTPTGFGADSAFANTPSTPEDKGTLTKFGSTGTGSVKGLLVGEPIKTEPLP
jgi:hypothetical protein